MWDENGFEVLKDCTSWEQDSLLNTIADKPLKPAPVNLQMMTLRARFNPQRNYEIWTFNTTEDFDEDALWNLAEDSPQGLVDMIRKHGKCLYKNHKNRSPKIQ
jgi:hypothetical protein